MTSPSHIPGSRPLSVAHTDGAISESSKYTATRPESHSFRDSPGVGILLLLRIPACVSNPGCEQCSRGISSSLCRERISDAGSTLCWKQVSRLSMMRAVRQILQKILPWWFPMRGGSISLSPERDGKSVCWWSSQMMRQGQTLKPSSNSSTLPSRERRNLPFKPCRTFGGVPRKRFP